MSSKSKHGSKSKTRKSAGTTKHIQAGLPIIFAMTTEQASRLKRIANDSLDRFREGKAVGIDFTNIHQRLVTGHHLCVDILHLEGDDASVFMPISEALIINHAIKDRAFENTKVNWHATPVEIEIIDEALDIIDQLQDQVSRRDLQTAFRQAQVSVKTALNKGRKEMSKT